MKIGDTISFNYGGNNVMGTIYSIYHNGDTINVVWGHKHTALHISQVQDYIHPYIIRQGKKIIINF